MKYNQSRGNTSRKTISIPVEYSGLFDQILDWLNNCSDKCSKYRTLKNITSNDYDPKKDKYSINSQEILKPLIFFKSYPVTRLCMQTLVDYYEFIYSPTALVNFLNNLREFRTTRDSDISYNQVGQWKLNYHNRSEKISEEFNGNVKTGKDLKEKEMIEFCKLHREEINQWLIKVLSSNYK